MAILYHFTAATTSHLGSILKEGQLRPTESNLSFDGEHHGPDVVWLTSNPDPQASSGWPQGPIKVSARLSVSATDAVNWPKWSRDHGISDEVYDGLAAVGDPSEWWVVERCEAAIKQAESEELVMPTHDPKKPPI